MGELASGQGFVGGILMLVSVPCRISSVGASVNRAVEHWSRGPSRCQAASANNEGTKDASSSASTDNNPTDASASPQRPIPWTLTFDLRERETIWTDENKVRMCSAVQEVQFETEALGHVRHHDVLTLCCCYAGRQG